MIKALDLHPLIENEFAAARPVLPGVTDVKSPYQVIHCFLSFAIKCARQGDQHGLKKCFAMAERFIVDGDEECRKAAELILVPSLGPFIFSHLSFIAQCPPLLVNLYREQMACVVTEPGTLHNSGE